MAEVESGMSAGRTWRRPRAAKLVLDHAPGALEPAREPRDTGSVGVTDERPPERRSGEGRLHARQQRIDRGPVLVALSKLRHQTLQRVAQVPFAEVELGLGEGRTDGTIETVVVVADHALRSALQGAQERLPPVGLGCVGEGLNAPELRAPALEARRAEDPKRSESARFEGHAPRRADHRARASRPSATPRAFGPRRRWGEDLDPVGHQLPVASHPQLSRLGSAGSRCAPLARNQRRLAVGRPHPDRGQRLGDPPGDELVSACGVRSLVQVDGALARVAASCQASSRCSTSVKRCGRSPLAGTHR